MPDRPGAKIGAGSESSAAAAAAPAPRAAERRLPIGRALGWSRIVTTAAGRPFAASLGAAVGLLLATQINVQVLANLVSALGAQQADPASARLYAAGFVATSLIVVALTVAGSMLASWSDATMLARLQQTLHDRLLALGPDAGRLGEPRIAAALVLQTAVTIQPTLRDVIAVPLVNGVALLSALALLFYNLDAIQQAPPGVDAALAVMLVLLPCGAMLISGRLRSAYTLLSRSLGQLGLEMANSAADAGEIAILGAQKQRSRRFAEQARRVASMRLTAALRLDAARQFHASLPIFVQAGFLVYGTYLLLSAGGTHLGGILAIYYFAPAVVRPVQAILDAYLQVSANWASIAQAGEILDAPAGRPAPPAAIAAPRQAAEIALGEVSFVPGPDAVPLLRELSHVFPAGSASVVIGRSGSGKSTLLSLIAGLRAPAGGTVRIDGSAPQAARRAAPGTIAFVSQTPLIITDTVRENFRLACDDAQDREIEAVCREVGLWPILETFAPHAPLDAMLSPAPGEGLSGGARRLLAIARVLLLKPQVVLLDEPTTGVDVLGLEPLLACLQRVARDATLVIVEHNLDFVWRLVGTVCCLEDGRFTECGDVAELANRPGLFQSMLRSRAALVAIDRMSIESVPLPTLDPVVPAPRTERASA